jgi:hypothetical protein
MTIDITSPKVLAPALLFAALSLTPGSTRPMIVARNALAVAVVYFLLARYVLKVTLTQADLVVPALLFALLTPGVLLTLPPGAGGVFRSGQTSTAAVGVHTAVFAVAFAAMRSSFPAYY